MLAALTDVFELELGKYESAVTRLAKLQGEKDNVADHVLELKFETVKLKAKVSSLKKKVDKLWAGKECAGAEFVAVGAHCNIFKDECTFQRMELKRLRITLVASTDFVELVNRHVAAKNASFVTERKEIATGLAEDKLLPVEAWTEVTAHRYRLREAFDQISLVLGDTTVEVKKARRIVTSAPREIGTLVRQDSTYKQSAEVVERYFTHAQYELDGALESVIRLPNRKTRRQKQIKRAIRRAAGLQTALLVSENS